MVQSPNNTIVTTSGTVITDAAGNIWGLSGGQVVVNGTIDRTTRNVIQLAYENGKVWQENQARLWWNKGTPSDPWQPAYGTTVSPLVGVASPNNAILVGSFVTGILGPSIRDANGDRWSISASGQVAVNGVVDPTTQRVIALAYENGKIWQENADRRWWSKTNAADSWHPPYGTVKSPIPEGTSSPVVTYLSGAVVDYTNTVSPSAYTVRTVDDGGKAITFNYEGRNVSAGTIRNAEGTLVVNVQGTLINSGTLISQGSIGSSDTTINVQDGAVVRNTGLIMAKWGPSGPINGLLHVTGSGTFQNAGTMNIDGGSSVDFDMTGTIRNAGSIVIDDSFGTHHSIVTTADIVNSGVIENHNATTIQWGYSGPPAPGAHDAAFINSGVIKSLYDVSQLTLVAGSFAHAVDAYLVHDYHGKLINNGQIIADGGGDRIEIAAPLVQSGTGHVDILNAATVKLDSTSDGGTIMITSGMLEFGGDKVAFHGQTGATGFHSDVVLNGAGASFGFERSDIALTFKATSPTSADLLINLTGIGAGEQIADIHLVGGYHASQFQLSGSQVYFTKAA